MFTYLPTTNDDMIYWLILYPSKLPMSKHRSLESKKRVKAKKPSKATRDKDIESKLNEYLPEINRDLLCEISQLIDTNPTASLKEIGKKYSNKIRQIINPDEGKAAYDDSSNTEYEDELVDLMIDSSSKKHHFVKSREPCFHSYYTTDYSKKRFTESYIVLGSFFNVNPLILPENTLSALLEMDFGFPNEDNGPVCYMDVKNVVKSKGNSINGPHREDVGKFNRKLFESYSKDMENVLQNRIFVDLKFYPEADRFIGKEEVISADLVNIFKYDGPNKEMLGGFIFIVHEKLLSTVFSAISGKNILFDRLDSTNVLYSRGKDKRRLNILQLETFTMFVVEFLSASVATAVFQSIFGDIPSEQICPSNLLGFL